MTRLILVPLDEKQKDITITFDRSTEEEFKKFISSYDMPFNRVIPSAEERNFEIRVAGSFGVYKIRLVNNK